MVFFPLQRVGTRQHQVQKTWHEKRRNENREEMERKNGGGEMDWGCRTGVDEGRKEFENCVFFAQIAT